MALSSICHHHNLFCGQHVLTQINVRPNTSNSQLERGLKNGALPMKHSSVSNSFSSLSPSNASVSLRSSCSTFYGCSFARSLGRQSVASTSLQSLPSSTIPLVCQKEELFEFLKSNGANVTKLSIEDVDPTSLDAAPGPARGLVATQDISPGDVLLSLPLALGLTDVISAQQPEPYPQAPWSVRLATTLLREKAKGRGSKWASYLALLPQEKVPLPIFFQPEEQKEVQYWRAEAAMYELSWVVNEAYDLIPQSMIGNAPREDFEWAMSIALSRALRYELRSGERKTVRALLPLVDFANHSFDNQLDWNVDEGRGTLELVAKSAIKQGQQAFISYGNHPNDHFFLYYGFYNKVNPYRQVVIFKDLEEAIEKHVDRFGVPGADLSSPSLEWQRDWLALCREMDSAAIAAAPDFEIEDGDEGAMKRAIEEARKIVVAEFGDVDPRLVAAYKVLEEAHKKVGTDVNAMRTIKERCEELLQSVPTTAEDDQRILATCNNEALKLAVQLRLGKKVMLNRALEKIGNV